MAGDMRESFGFDQSPDGFMAQSCWMTPVSYLATTTPPGLEGVIPYHSPANEPSNDAFFQGPTEPFLTSPNGPPFGLPVPEVATATEYTTVPDAIIPTTESYGQRPDRLGATDRDGHVAQPKTSNKKGKNPGKVGHNRQRRKRAAQESRARKRNEQVKLESSHEVEKYRNECLLKEVESLTQEKHRLKTQILQHTDCDCVLIQEYIRSDAERSVAQLLTSPSTSKGDCSGIRRSQGSGDCSSFIVAKPWTSTAQDQSILPECTGSAYGMPTVDVLNGYSLTTPSQPTALPGCGQGVVYQQDPTD